MKSLRVLIITTEAPDVAVGGLGFFHQMLWQHLKSMKVDFRTVYLNKNNTPPPGLPIILWTSKMNFH